MSDLCFEQVAARRGDRVVLDFVNLRVHSGEVVVVTGRSGTGKSTLLRVACGLEVASRGRIRLGDRVLASPDDGVHIIPRKRRLAMVFQDFSLWPHLSACDNVAIVMRGAMRANRVEAAALLRRFGLHGCENAKPGDLSGGQQQRVAIARALATRPEALLMDEAFSNLDHETAEQLRLDIRSLLTGQDMAVLAVSHHPADLWQLASRVAVLEGGSLSQVACPTLLYERPETPYIARLTGALNGLDGELRYFADRAELAVGATRIPGVAFGVPDGGRARMLVRPQGIVAEPANGPTAAKRTRMAFEGGQYRSHWQLPDVDTLLCSVSPTPPPERACLRFDRSQVFFYPFSAPEGGPIHA